MVPHYWSTRLFSRFRNRPGSSPFISGDGFRAFSDIVIEQDSVQGVAKISRASRGDIVFCQSDFLEFFRERLLAELREPIILITGNSDSNQDADLAAIQSHDKVSRVFAQNLTVPVKGVSPIPIGLENSHLAKVGQPQHYWNRSDPTDKRATKVMYSFADQNNEKVRSRARTVLAKMPLAHDLGRVSVSKHQKALLGFQFVASPPGNGLDTHRTWEAMYLGCVPIVLKSEATVSFERLGLPLWVVNDYSEIEEFSESDFDNKYLEITSTAELSWLWMPRWEKEIRLTSRRTRQRK